MVLTWRFEAFGAGILGFLSLSSSLGTDKVVNSCMLFQVGMAFQLIHKLNSGFHPLRTEASPFKYLKLVT